MPFLNSLSSLCFLMLAGQLALSAAAENPASIAIGTDKQLLVDDFAINQLSGIQRELGTVTRMNAGKPIFTEGQFYGSVLHDQGRFKMWWRKHGRQGFGYAESTDGIHFKTIDDVTGINFAGDYSLSVMIDPHEQDPAHRYKAAYDAPGMAAGLAHSADGKKWTTYNDGQPVTHRAADTYNQISWDEAAQTYRLFTRTDFGTPGGGGEVRGTRSMTNPDPRQNPTDWKLVRNWIFNREGPEEVNRRQIYAVADWIYEGVHFGLMSVYEWPGDTSEGPTDLVKRHERDVMNYYLATSRNGDDWDLSWIYSGQPLLPRGPDGSFDKDLVLPSSSVVTYRDRHWLYYSGANERHGTPEVVFPRESAIGVATLPLDRFVGLAASGDKVGTIVTRSFTLTGSRLQLNVAAAEGSYRVEILAQDGQPIEGLSGRAARTYRGLDQLRHQPRWKGSKLKQLEGQVVRLRFTLHGATLYSFQVLP